MSALARRLAVAASLAGCAGALTAEPLAMSWTVAGAERRAIVFPPAAPGAGGAPVVFAFHGHGGTAEWAARSMRFQEVWPEALVVYMQGLPTPGALLDRQGKLPGWQHLAGDFDDRDLKFFDAVLSTLRAHFRVDERRIYATGHSNGGLFTYLLWSERGAVFAALAPSAAVLLPAMRPSVPKPILHLAGEKDELVPFGFQKRTIERARRIDGAAAPVETFLHPGGHTYAPGASEAIVRFFQGHQLGEKPKS